MSKTRNKKHKYQGGQIVPSSVGEHYHVDYLYGDDLKMGWGLVIDAVADDRFLIADEEGEWLGSIKGAEFTKLTDALRFCFNIYKLKHPNTRIEPLWGAGAANEALEEIGFTPPVIPRPLKKDN